MSPENAGDVEQNASLWARIDGGGKNEITSLSVIFIIMERKVSLVWQEVRGTGSAL